MPPPSLLTIPLEVRAMIIIEVAVAPQTSPPSPSDLHGQNRRTLDRDVTGAYEETDRVFFQADAPSNPVLPLLLTNRQLHAETLDTLRRAFSTTTTTRATNPLSYTAHVIYLKNATLWPTWLSVPIQASHIDTLHAQFRIFPCPEGKEMPEASARGSMFRAGPGVPAAIVWPFWHLLIGSLCSGTHSPCGIPFSVGRLVLNFVPVQYPGDDDDKKQDGGYHGYGAGAGEGASSDGGSSAQRVYGPIIPEFFVPHLRLHTQGKLGKSSGMDAAARLMSFALEKIEYMAKLDAVIFDLGKKLHENIGVVEIRLDGEVFETLDLARYLDEKEAIKKWRATNRRTLRRKDWRWETDFLAWKKEVEARRRELGMEAGEKKVSKS